MHAILINQDINVAFINLNKKSCWDLFICDLQHCLASVFQPCRTIKWKTNSGEIIGVAGTRKFSVFSEKNNAFLCISNDDCSDPVADQFFAKKCFILIKENGRFGQVFIRKNAWETSTIDIEDLQ
jgi:hypothetical protein